jgi:CBS domain-containing protein
MKITDTIGLVLKSKGVRNVLSIAPEQLVYEALEMMAEYDIGASAGALRKSAGRHSVGARLRAQRRPDGSPFQRDQVQQIMTSPVVFVSPKHTVDECLSMMTQHRIRHLPVFQDDTVIGIVSIGDLVKWVISGQERTIQDLHGYIAGAYPALLPADPGSEHPHCSHGLLRRCSRMKCIRTAVSPFASRMPQPRRSS